jgi:hypothetical protein
VVVQQEPFGQRRRVLFSRFDFGTSSRTLKVQSVSFSNPGSGWRVFASADGSRTCRARKIEVSMRWTILKNVRRFSER